MRRRLLISGAVVACLLSIIVSTEQANATVVTISDHAAQVVDGKHGATAAVRVTVSATSGTTVSASYTTANGTAVAGTDYTAKSGTVSIPAGKKAATINVPITAQATLTGGPDLSFSVVLSNPSNASLGTATATVTIHKSPYVATHSGALANIAVDPTGTKAYISNSNLNEVEVLNLKTGTYAKPIFVGSHPYGLDVTPDGLTLYVANSGGQNISKVDLATNKEVTKIATPTSFTNDRPLFLVVANDGFAYFSTTFAGSGFGGHFYALNLSTEAITVATQFGIGGQSTEFSPLARSADGGTIAALLGDDSGGTTYRYRTSDKTSKSTDLNGFYDWLGVSGDGKYIVVDGGGLVIDSDSMSLDGTVSPGGYGITANLADTTGYQLQSGHIQLLNLNRLLQGTTISLPDSSGQTGSQYLVLADKTKTIATITKSGVTIIRM